MTPARITAWILVAGVLGAWLASAAGVSRGTGAARVPEAPAVNPTDHLADDVQAQARRLRQRMDAAPAPQTPARNPFAFSVRERVLRAPVAPAAPAPPPAPVAPPEPPLELVGIAEKKAGETVVRTAMMSDQSGDVIMATVGQRVTVYDVVAIGHDAVELKHVTTGAVRRLALR